MFDSNEKWWVKLTLGLLGIIFGVLFILLPSVPWLIIAVLVGVFLIMMGFTLLFGGMLGGGATGGNRALAMIVGLMAIVIGMIALVFPGWTDIFIIFLLGFWLIFLGVAEMAGGNLLPQEVADKIAPRSKTLLVISGFLDVMIGFIFILMPLVGGVVVAWMAGLLLVLLGMIYIYMAMTGKKIDVVKA